MIMNGKTKVLLLATTAALCITAPAFAQTSAATATPDTATSSKLEEVVVTARKTSEDVQSIPEQVTVFTADRLDRLSAIGLKDIAAATPGFSFENYSGPIGAPVIRGQAQTVLTNTVQNVGVYFDGVYLQRSYMVDASLLDISNVEIVKGPQSALYGRNAFSGAIVYETNSKTNAFSADANTTVGSDGRLDYGGAIAIPLTSWLSMRFSGEHTEFDGTWPNNNPLANGSGCSTCGHVGGYSNDGYLFSLMAKPLSNLDINLTYSHTQLDDESAAGYILGSADPGTMNCSPTAGGGAATDRLYCGQLSASVKLAPGETRPPGIDEDPRSYGDKGGNDILSLRAEYRLNSNWSFDYMFGYAYSNVSEVGNSQRNPATSDLPSYLAPFLPPPLNLLAEDVIFDSDPNGYIRTFQDDLKIQYRDSKLRAFVGVNSSQTDDQFLGIVVGGTPNSLTPLTNILPYLSDLQHENSTSVYGFVEYKFTSRLSLTAEGRWSNDAENFTSFLATAANYNTSNGYEQSKTFQYFTPRFTGEYKLAADHALYASAAKGEKDGGFNGGPYFFHSKEATACPTVTTPTIANCAAAQNIAQQSFLPETNWTYEIGSKNEFLDHTLRLNVSAYYVDWTNIQISVAQEDTGTAAGVPVAALTGNVGGATVKGLEIEGEWLATPHLSINYGLDVHSSKYSKGAVAQDFLAAQVCDGVVCSAANPNIAGKSLQHSPDDQADLGVQYADHFGPAYNWYVRADVTYQSKEYEDEENLSWVPSRTLVNMRAGLSHDRWSIEAWVKNLADLHYVSSAFVLVGTNGAGSSAYTPFLGDLRTFGVTLKAHY
jgi:iron complex outermembrane receptor protein